MQRSNGARLFPLFIILIIVALLIAAVISIGRAVFNAGQNGGEETVLVDRGREALLKTDLARSVSMTVRGPIVAQENFTSYRVTVSPTERTMDIFKGYLEERTGGKTLDNNSRAYEEFVHALDKANMMKANNKADDEDINDLRGICASGYLYEFAVLNNAQEVEKLWTSTCEGSISTLNASKDQLSGLFLEQVPGSNDLVPFRQSPMLRF